MPPFIYDEVRYSSFPYAQTHPDRLSTVAVLHGLEPPDPFRSRVLEIGCGAGGNLLTMAAATPGLHAVGVDLAASAIEEGQRIISSVGLENVELHHADVRSLTDGSLGDFDYIVAHGVYGWIPEDEIVSALRDRPGFQHVVVTGRDASPGLIEAADLVSEVTKVKHPMDAGIRAQQGIEW